MRTGVKVPARKVVPFRCSSNSAPACVLKVTSAIPKGATASESCFVSKPSPGAFRSPVSGAALGRDGSPHRTRRALRSANLTEHPRHGQTGGHHVAHEYRAIELDDERLDVGRGDARHEDEQSFLFAKACREPRPAPVGQNLRV